MQQLSISFGFRQPYQCIVDADLVKDTTRFKMDLLASLERTLHGKVKPRTLPTGFPLICPPLSTRESARKTLIANTDRPPTVITQCSIRHLYKENTDPTVAAAIEVAKTVCERRRCGHHPEQYPEPLSTLECLSSIVDPQHTGNNKHRYCVASQDVEVRRAMRAVRGVPLVYVSRSVMVMEPLSDATALTREREERAKFRGGIIRSGGVKRKRDEDANDEDGSDAGSGSEGEGGNGKAADDGEESTTKKKRKRTYGPKGPNPLAVKKSKKEQQQKTKKKPATEPAARSEPVGGESAEPKAKRKRRKKRKAEDGGGDGGGEDGGGEGGDGKIPVQSAED